MAGASSLIFAAPAALAQADNDGAWYFFGDSATGQGNYTAIVGEQGEDHAPYSFNNGLQRESNGLIWAEMMGRDVDAFFDPARNSRNINFAVSGAHMTRGGDLVDFGVETGVETQTELFDAMVSAGDITVSRDDTFFMLAGANDFLDRLEQDDDANEIIADVAAAAASNVQRLANAGARTIVLAEIQPIQYAPQFADAPEVQSALTDLMTDANAQMFDAVMQAELPDDVNIITMKYSDFVAYMMKNSQALGFTNTTTPCYDDDAETLCATDKAGQNTHVFFDHLHFTEKAHAIEADWWQATLAGASGTASHQTGLAPRFVFEHIEAASHLVQPGAHLSDETPYAVYASPLYSSYTLTPVGASPHTSGHMDGAVIGLEARLWDSIIAGGALSVGDTTAKFEDGGGYTLKGGGLSLYGAVDFANYRFSLTGTKGSFDIDDIRRPTGVTLLSAAGQTDADYWDVELSARSVDLWGSFTIDHGVSLSTGQVKVDGYFETGATGLALSFEDIELDTRQFGLDTKVSGPSWRVLNAVEISPTAELAYAYQFGDDNYAVRSRLIDNTADTATVRAVGPAEHRSSAGLGARLIFGAHITADLQYRRTFADDLNTADAGNLNVRLTF